AMTARRWAGVAIILNTPLPIGGGYGARRSTTYSCMAGSTVSAVTCWMCWGVVSICWIMVSSTWVRRRMENSSIVISRVQAVAQQFDTQVARRHISLRLGIFQQIAQMLDILVHAVAVEIHGFVDVFRSHRQPAAQHQHDRFHPTG